MNGKQDLIAFGGLGLLAVNAWSGPDRQALDDLAQLQISKALPGLKTIGIELAFVIVLTAVAGASDQVATLVLVVIVGLWIIWGIRHYGNPSASPAVTKQPAKTTKTNQTLD